MFSMNRQHNPNPNPKLNPKLNPKPNLVNFLCTYEIEASKYFHLLAGFVACFVAAFNAESNTHTHTFDIRQMAKLIWLPSKPTNQPKPIRLLLMLIKPAQKPPINQTQPLIKRTFCLNNNRSHSHVS